MLFKFTFRRITYQYSIEFILKISNILNNKDFVLNMILKIITKRLDFILKIFQDICKDSFIIINYFHYFYKKYIHNDFKFKGIWIGKENLHLLIENTNIPDYLKFVNLNSNLEIYKSHFNLFFVLIFFFLIKDKVNKIKDNLYSNYIWNNKSIETILFKIKGELIDSSNNFIEINLNFCENIIYFKKKNKIINFYYNEINFEKIDNKTILINKENLVRFRSKKIFKIFEDNLKSFKQGFYKNLNEYQIKFLIDFKSKIINLI